MNTFKKLALSSTLATYFLIFIGGLVRVSGAGLGCPDWPKCFGRWIPPTDVSQLPSDFNPAFFNFTLAWIEYINRLAGVLVGLIIAATAVYALFYLRKHRTLLWGSVAAAILTAFQGWLGSVVVSSELSPMIVTIHMVVALVIVSILIYIWQKAWYKTGEKESGKFPKGLLQKIQVLWLAIIVQIIFGTLVRGKIELLTQRFPLLPDQQLLAKAGAINLVHFIFALILIMLTVYIWREIQQKSATISLLVRQVNFSILLLVFIQVLIGFVLWVFGLPQLAQLFHLWVASIFTGMVLILYTAVKSGGVYEK